MGIFSMDKNLIKFLNYFLTFLYIGVIMYKCSMGEFCPLRNGDYLEETNERINDHVSPCQEGDSLSGQG